MLAHLQKEGIEFTQRRANGQALIQLFFYDPNGIKIELNFAADEMVDEEKRRWTSPGITTPR
jgi:hypothetical protein